VIDETRFKAVEEHVTNLRIDNGRQAECIEHLTKAVENLATVVTDLSANMNRGKGALWIFGIMSATAGGLISWATTLLFR
jgi:hypothetical protein